MRPTGYWETTPAAKKAAMTTPASESEPPRCRTYTGSMGTMAVAPSHCRKMVTVRVRMSAAVPGSSAAADDPGAGAAAGWARVSLTVRILSFARRAHCPESWAACRRREGAGAGSTRRRPAAPTIVPQAGRWRAARAPTRGLAVAGWALLPPPDHCVWRRASEDDASGAVARTDVSYWPVILLSAQGRRGFRFPPSRLRWPWASLFRS